MMNGSYSATLVANVLSAVGVAELVIAILGVPINILVVSISARLVKSYNHRNKVLILSMAVADLTICSFHAPLMSGQFLFDKVYPNPLCSSLYFVTYVCNIASSLSLLSLNIDKFYTLHKPLHYTAKVTRRKLRAGVALSWATAVVWSSVFLFGPATSPRKNRCGYQASIIHVYTSFLVIFFMLPNFVSFCLSCFIVCIVMRSHFRACERRNRPENATMEEQLLDSSVHRTPLQKTMSRKRAIRKNWREVRSIIFVFSTTIWSVFTTLPYRFGIILAYLQLTTADTSSFLQMMFMFVMMSATPLGNPLITIFTQRIYANNINRICHAKSISRASTHSTAPGSKRGEKRKRTVTINGSPPEVFVNTIMLATAEESRGPEFERKLDEDKEIGT